MDTQTTIGILGGGQLGRMFAQEARHMGYRVLQWTDGEKSGAERLADHALIKPFDDPEALAQFIEECDYVTVEFENIPPVLIEELEKHLPTFPKANAIRTCQDRQREKEFLQSNGIPTVAFRIVSNAQELEEALADFPGEVIIKTAQFGYDGKGQLAVPALVDRPSAEELWEPFQGIRAIVEEKITLVAELSVMVARGQDGSIITYDPAENEHKDHILHLSFVPARLPLNFTLEAQDIAKKIATALDYVGIMGVEFFINDAGNLLVNEMAPRPHNSGHHTLDACVTSQFEQQLRATVGLPLGSPRLLSPVVMLNLLGRDGLHSSNLKCLTIEGANLHLYGKGEAKEKRKMGHINFLAPTIEEGAQNAEKALQLLRLP